MMKRSGRLYSAASFRTERANQCRVMNGVSQSLPEGARDICPVTSMTSATASRRFPSRFEGRVIQPAKRGTGRRPRDGMERLKARRPVDAGWRHVHYIRYLDDFPAFPIYEFLGRYRNAGFAAEKMYVVQTARSDTALRSDDHRPAIWFSILLWLRHDRIRCRAMGPPLDHR